MNKHTEILEKIKPLLVAVELPDGASSIEINDCSDNSYSLFVNLDMGQRPYMLYNHNTTKKPYNWLQQGSAAHPDTKVGLYLNSVVAAVKKQLRAIPGLTVRRHASPKAIYNWDTVEKRNRKEGYDRAYIEFDVDFYPQD